MNEYGKDEVFGQRYKIPNNNFQTYRTVRDSLSRSKSVKKKLEKNNRDFFFFLSEEVILGLKIQRKIN